MHLSSDRVVHSAFFSAQIQIFDESVIRFCKLQPKLRVFFVASFFLCVCVAAAKSMSKKQLSLVKNVHTNAHTKYNKLNVLFAAYSKANKMQQTAI